MFKFDYNGLPFDFKNSSEKFICCDNAKNDFDYCPDCKKVVYNDKVLGKIIKGEFKPTPSIYYAYDYKYQEICRDSKRINSLKCLKDSEELRKELITNSDYHFPLNKKVTSLLQYSHLGLIIQEIQWLTRGVEVTPNVPRPSKEDVIGFIKEYKLEDSFIKALLFKNSK